MSERRRAFVEHFAALEKCNTTSIVNNRRPDGIGKYAAGVRQSVLSTRVSRKGSQMEIDLKHRLSLVMGWGGGVVLHVDIH